MTTDDPSTAPSAPPARRLSAEDPRTAGDSSALTAAARRALAAEHRLPDFVIVGAQKCGTSSLHHILAQHPQVFIPTGEVFFFDVDDVDQHPDFNVHVGDEWVSHDWEGDFERYLAWYADFFSRAPSGAMLGEDSTTYLASRVAPQRIAETLPDAKIIIMLRDPVARAYSHYWHGVRMGRGTRTFEQTLTQQPGNLLRRGRYAEQIRRYQQWFPAERLKVLFFEEFVRDTQAAVDAICAWLGLASSVSLDDIQTHRNAASAPLSPTLKRAWNQLKQPFSSGRYTRHLPGTPGFVPPSQRQQARESWLAAAYDRVNEGRTRRRYPPIKPETRRLLEQHFRRENAQLSELLQRDVSELWSYMPGAGD